MFRSWKLAAGRSLVFTLLALSLGPTPQATATPLRIRVKDSAGMAVRRALLAARKRLAEPRCRQVFTEFHSSAMRKPLTETLALMDRTPEEHLDTLTFQDGSRKGPCASSTILAFTRPGDDTIYVCASQFRSAVQSDPAYAEMILIHEMLHTLGLGENPPTSLEITARVTELCGGAAADRSASTQ
jgi:hypothetical protein